MPRGKESNIEEGVGRKWLVDLRKGGKITVVTLS